MRLLNMPKGFLWGAATSGHQVEGHNINSDWWKWELEGRVAEKSGRACDHYRVFKEDIQLARNLGHNAYRFSAEWSRIEPVRGEFSEDALAHYNEVISFLRQLNIEPIVTLNHFTVPLWFYDKGGWLNPESTNAFRDYVAKVVSELGEGVKYWITINEPGVYAHGGYIEGNWPPGRKSYTLASRVLVSLMRAHCLAYQTIHDIYRKRSRPAPLVSISKHIMPFEPCRAGSLKDKIPACLRNYYFNDLTVRSLISGRIVAPGFGFIRLPAKNTLDFLGINYYRRELIRFKGLFGRDLFGEVCDPAGRDDAGERNYLGWEIYPEGLYNVLKRYSEYGLPMMITENGICTENDRERIKFIENHLEAISRAIREGVNVCGYLYWSLLDNFEWAHGFGPRFGLVEVDYDTLRRRTRESGLFYSGIIKDNGGER
jgi:beta-glucosidase